MLRERLEALGVQTMTLSNGAVTSYFDLPGGAGGEDGRVLWDVQGEPSLLERGTEAAVLSAFAPRAALANLKDMHTVLAFSFHRAWEDVTVRSLAWSFGGMALAPAVDALGLRALTLLVANRDTDLAVMPQLRPLAHFAGEGVSIKAVLPLDAAHGSLASLSSRLQRILGGTTRVHLVAPLGYESLAMTAHTPDLWLGGRGGGGAAKGLLQGSGAEMLSPELRISVDAHAVRMEFAGQVLLPVTEGETLHLSGKVKIDAAAQTLLLEAGTSQPLFDAFGIPNMHLSYGVVEQTVSGVADTRYMMQAQLSLGIACSPYELSLADKGPKAAYAAAVNGVDADRDKPCVSGTAVVILNPSAPEQDMLAAEVALPRVQKLLAFCGLDRADILPVQGVVQSWVWRGVQRVTFGVVSHAWFDDVRDWRGSPRHAYFVDPQQQLQTVPEGLAGSGTLRVMGEWVPASFVSSRVDETLRLTAVLPAMEWPGLRISGMAPVSGGGDEWASVGPMVKLGGKQVGGVAKVVLQGYADLIGIRQWFAADVTDKGVDLRVVGHVHGGVLMSVRATAPAAAALHLRPTAWSVQGSAVESSLRALGVRMEAEARDLCAYGRGSRDCSRQVAARVQQGGWLHLCSLTTQETLRHGQLGLAVADWRRASVSLRAWVSGRTVTLSIGHVDLSDWTRAARTLTRALLPHATGHGSWEAIPQECSAARRQGRASAGSDSAERWPPWTLPGECDTLGAVTLPTPASLTTAVLRDNAIVEMRLEDRELWRRHQPLIARARYRAAVQAFDRGRAAWETDQVVRRAITSSSASSSSSSFSASSASYPVVKPAYIADPAGAPTDLYSRYLGATVCACR
eukprot:Tamp_01091.p1 GENE.Tamp_01091~~Tamp_01091.p1  ORF type:complete len:853 (+),score=200.76 Tamp_01091:3276-5834(+)